MTEVIFHLNIDDKLGHTCGYVRKALANARRVVVVGDDDQLQLVSQRLWDTPRTGFVAHCDARTASSTMLASSPVVLGAAGAEWPHQDILVNLAGEVPQGFEAFGRLVELVGNHEDDLQASRQRWKFYRARGYSLRSIDMLQRDTPGEAT